MTGTAKQQDERIERHQWLNVTEIGDFVDVTPRMSEPVMEHINGLIDDGMSAPEAVVNALQEFAGINRKNALQWLAECAVIGVETLTEHRTKEVGTSSDIPLEGQADATAESVAVHA